MSRIFYTSLGHPQDFDRPEFRKLLNNAVFWALDRQPDSRTRSQLSTATAKEIRDTAAENPPPF